MKPFKIILNLSYLICVSSIILFIISYPDLKETVPLHYNYKGEVDAIGSKKVFAAFTNFVCVIISLNLLFD